MALPLMEAAQANNLWAQLGLLAIVAVIVFALAWQYVW
jgi:hypothetical protein